MKYLYGEFGVKQFNDAITYIRKKIFFLLVVVDKYDGYKFQDVDVEKCFDDIFAILDGLNCILRKPKELVTTVSLLESALLEYTNPDFDFFKYRKLILDAGNEIQKIKEVEKHADP